MKIGSPARSVRRDSQPCVVPMPTACTDLGRPWLAKHPRVLKDYTIQLPVIYYHSNKEWFNAGIFQDWFYNHFVSEVRRFQKKEMKFDDEEIKVLLLLDNVPAHPSEEKLQSTDGKIKVMFLPPNTNVIHPAFVGQHWRS
uniref:DDE-1 domain-containing protein n=1 Tax=Scylla olivacea TaxID=85551 RepID=A0A0N7ZCK0_SCYOL